MIFIARHNEKDNSEFKSMEKVTRIHLTICPGNHGNLQIRNGICRVLWLPTSWRNMIWIKQLYTSNMAVTNVGGGWIMYKSLWLYTLVAVVGLVVKLLLYIEALRQASQGKECNFDSCWKLNFYISYPHCWLMVIEWWSWIVVMKSN